MTSLHSKLPEIEESIFAVMTRMAAEANAINLSQGFPDFNCPKDLIELVHKYQLQGLNQYAPMPGVQPLREQISRKTESLYGSIYDPNKEITVTAGATQALFTAITAFIGLDDEVIIFTPAYDAYVPDIKINGGVPVPIALDDENFTIPWDKVKDKITPKTKMIILNSPHNPAGALITKEDIEELTELALKHNLLILNDEVYEHIVFDGKEHLSLAGVEALKERALVVSSFGKTYHTTGWKIGYLLADEKLTKEFRKVHQFNVFAVNTPIQHAYAEFMKETEHYLNLHAFYQEKRDYFIEQMRGSEFFIKPAGGTYFQLLDYTEITDMPDTEFAEYLTKEIGVAVIPLTPFYLEKKTSQYVRICFAKTEEVLKKAADKLLTVNSKSVEKFRKKNK